MSASSIIRTAVILSLVAPAALAQEFDGVYEYAFCDDPPYVALTIEGETVSFYETPCTLADAAPQAEPSGAVQFTMSCDYGSGPQASTVVLFFNPDGDLVLRSDGQEDRFVSCTEG
jgi:hypothetical protein